LLLLINVDVFEGKPTDILSGCRADFTGLAATD